MLAEAIKKREIGQVALLGSSLIDHLYDAQEQVITPLYLSLTGDLKHGLTSMSEQFNIECSEDNDKGTFWVRYPHASAEYYRTFHRSIPLGLRVILTLADNSEDPIIVMEQISPLIELTKSGIVFIQNVEEIQKKPRSEKYIQNLNEKIEQLTLSTKINEEISIGKTQKKINSELENYRSQLQVLQKKLNAKAFEQNLSFKISSLQDLIVHIQRLISAIDLFEEFPEQKFLSIHEHNLRVLGQYLPEIAFSVISQLEGDEFHTHNFKVASSLLNLEEILSKEELEMLQDLNIKKGGDYIYWEFFNKPKTSSSSLLRLSEAYELSLEARMNGEGFIPSSYKPNCLKQKRENLFELISTESNLLNNLVNIILQMMT